jgi:hypothetical protein
MSGNCLTVVQGMALRSGLSHWVSSCRAIASSRASGIEDRPGSGFALALLRQVRAGGSAACGEAGGGSVSRWACVRDWARTRRSATRRVVGRQGGVGLHRPAGVVSALCGGESPPARTAVRARMTALSQDEPRRTLLWLLPHHFARPTAQVAGTLEPGRFRRRFHRRSCPSRFRSHGNSGIRSFDNRITPAVRCDPAGTDGHPKVVQ